MDERERKKSAYVQGKRKTGKEAEKKEISSSPVKYYGYCRSNAIQTENYGIFKYRVKEM